MSEEAPPPLFEGGCSAQQLLNLTGYFVFLIVTSLGGAGVLQESIGRVSRSLPTALTPAGNTSSIWIVIFSLTGALSFYQVAPSRREWAWKEIGWWWAANVWLGEVLWTFAWCGRWGNMWVSAFLFLFIVITLVGLYLRIDAGYSLARRWPNPPALAPTPKLRNWTESVLLEGSIGLYMGWTTAAAIVNVSIALTASGVPASGPATAPASVVVLLIICIIAMCGAYTRLDFWFSGAIAWALWGIRTQQLNEAWPVREPATRDAATATAVVATASAFAALLCRGFYVYRGSVCENVSSVSLANLNTEARGK